MPEGRSDAGHRSMNMSRDISYIQSNNDKPLATSQPSSIHGNKQDLPPNSLLDYFSSNPPQEEEVDVDAALNDHNLDHQGVQPSEITFSALNPEQSYMEVFYFEKSNLKNAKDNNFTSSGTRYLL